MRVFPNIYRTPFGKSNLKFFVGQATASKVGGVFVFSGQVQDFIVVQPLIQQALYFFWDFDFTADLAEADYQEAIVPTAIPLISVVLASTPTQPIFRQPFPAPLYYQNAIIYQGVQTLINPDYLKFSLTGQLSATPALTSKAVVTGTVRFTAHEILDADYIRTFREGLDVREPPKPGEIAGKPKELTPTQKLAHEKSQMPGLTLEEGMELPSRGH